MLSARTLSTRFLFNLITIWGTYLETSVQVLHNNTENPTKAMLIHPKKHRLCRSPSHENRPIPFASPIEWSNLLGTELSQVVKSTSICVHSKVNIAHSPPSPPVTM